MMVPISTCLVRSFLSLTLLANSIIVGFCHVVFREPRSVSELLKHCTQQQRSTIDYFLHIHMSPTTTTISGLPSCTNRLKPVCIIIILYECDHCQCLDSSCALECERQCICNASREYV
jgi:hypothetical protein